MKGSMNGFIYKEENPVWRNSEGVTDGHTGDRQEWQHSDSTSGWMARESVGISKRSHSYVGVTTAWILISVYDIYI